MFRFLLITLICALPLSAQESPALKCGLGDHSAHISKRATPTSRGLDYLEESVLSPSGMFRIHYTLSGVHAVDSSQSGDTPLFVVEAALAADSAYQVMVNEMGFDPPADDQGVDGAELDIYIKNWQGSYYGMTYFDSYEALPVFPGYPSYLVVDNDYVESSYATKGLDALRVTIAHEFFHMVQLAYAHPGELNWDNLFWYEISSTWMEEVCYPEINDYHAYVEDNFRQIKFPDLNGPTAYSYGHALFGQILDIEYGSSDGKHIIRDLWEQLHGNDAIDNLYDILSSEPWNSSMTEALGSYALHNVFTGSRSIGGEYYPDAAELPEIRLSSYDLPLGISGPDFEFELAPLETMYKKFTIPSLSDFAVKGVGLTSEQRLYLTATKLSEGSSLKGALSNFWIPCNQIYSTDFLIIAMANGGRSDAPFSLRFEGGTIELSDQVQALWPNPVLSDAGTIHLNMILADKGPLVFSIYDILGRRIYKRFSENLVEGIFETDLPLPQNLEAGIYFLQIQSGQTRLNQKFTVLR